ncbi:hypothetical protein CEXT_337101 [Caerostris extrusa]|uniref:Secreted protein n=1 Tax=Caerostris extrusa TaxID=172846 RepID=A0AAV4MUK9_CAEEX|nr:hypothetical protein CEXT_337101 [Caerostris extrusa]
MVSWCRISSVLSPLDLVSVCCLWSFLDVWRQGKWRLAAEGPASAYANGGRIATCVCPRFHFQIRFTRNVLIYIRRIIPVGLNRGGLSRNGSVIASDGVVLRAN